MSVEASEVLLRTEEVCVMMNNNNGFRVIAGGLSNEEYAARQLRKEDLAVWGTPDTWDEEIVWHMAYADEDEFARFMEYLAEDDEEEVAPQLYAINNDESYDEEYEDDITYEAEMQELLRKQELEIAELLERQKREMDELCLKCEQEILSMGIVKLLGKSIVRGIKKIFGAK